MCLSVFGGTQSAREIKLVAPLYITNAQVKSVLMVGNPTDNAVAVRASFISLEGEEVGYRLLRLPPHSSVSIDVDSVAMGEHRFATLGSVSLTATSMGFDDPTAHLTIESRNNEDRLSVEEKLQAVGDTAGKREFMKPRDGAKEVLRARCRRDGRNP
jgi:hypothetical protein